MMQRYSISAKQTNISFVFVLYLYFLNKFACYYIYFCIFFRTNTIFILLAIAFFLLLYISTHTYKENGSCITTKAARRMNYKVFSYSAFDGAGCSFFMSSSMASSSS